MSLLNTWKKKIENGYGLSNNKDITKELRCDMMKHVHKINYSSIVNTDSGTLEAYFNNDVN